MVLKIMFLTLLFRNYNHHFFFFFKNLNFVIFAIYKTMNHLRQQNYKNERNAMKYLSNI